MIKQKDMRCGSTDGTKNMQIDRAVIEINGGCNYTCQMCPQTTEDGKTGARGKNWTGKMPLTDFENYVAQCAEAGLNVVNLDGSGEATVMRDLPKYIEIVEIITLFCQHVSQRGSQVIR
jgi:hypothetical protein